MRNADFLRNELLTPRYSLTTREKQYIMKEFIENYTKDVVQKMVEKFGFQR